MKIFQALRTGLLVAGVLSFAAGCGDREAGGAPEQAAQAPEPGGIAVLVESQDMDTPMPLYLGTALAGQLQDMMYMSLLHASWEDGAMEYRTADESPMAIARGYQLTGADSATLRFHLRSDLKWSDGRPLTAQDVVWTYRALGNPETGALRSDYATQLDSVVAPSDSTVEFHFRQRYPDMLVHANHAIVPAHVYEGVAAAGLRQHRSVTNPSDSTLVVSGPFQLQRWERGQQVVLARNPHFQPRAHLDQVVVRIIPEETTRMVELQTGGVDYVRPISFDQITALRQRVPELEIEREEKRFYDFIAYNPEAVSAFADPEIRRALGLAIDVPRMIEGLGIGDYVTPAAGPYPPIFRELQDPALQPLGHDPARAREILEAKGWRDTDGDGIRDKDGEPFRFTLTTNAGNQRRADALQIVQQQWREIGVDAQLEQLEFATLAQKLFQGRDYQAVLFGWQVQLSPDMRQIWEPGSPYNFTGYQNPELQALFEQAMAQSTPEEAAPYWRRAAAELVEDQPYTWLYYMDQASVRRPGLRGMKIDTYGPYQNAWEWWIPSAQRRGAKVVSASAGR